MIDFPETIPILRSFDEAKAKAFYVGYLGMALDWEHRFEPDMPLYFQVSRNGLRLHVSEHHGDATPGSAVFVTITGIDEFHAELRGRDYPALRPGIEDTPWGSRQMTLTDPFGNRLAFNERIASR